MLTIPLAILGTIVYASIGTTVALKELNLKYLKEDTFGLWIRALLFVTLWPIYLALNFIYF